MSIRPDPRPFPNTLAAFLARKTSAKQTLLLRGLVICLDARWELARKSPSRRRLS